MSCWHDVISQTGLRQCWLAVSFTAFGNNILLFSFGKCWIVSQYHHPWNNCTTVYCRLFLRCTVVHFALGCARSSRTPNQLSSRSYWSYYFSTSSSSVPSHGPSLSVTGIVFLDCTSRLGNSFKMRLHMYILVWSSILFGCWV